jgi:hypothetical protein
MMGIERWQKRQWNAHTIAISIVGQYLDTLSTSLFDQSPLLDNIYICYHEQDYLPYLLWQKTKNRQYLDTLTSSLFDQSPLLGNIYICYHKQDYLPYLLWQKTKNSQKNHNYYSWIQTQIWFCQEVEFLSFQAWNLQVLQPSNDFTSTQSWLWQALPICIWHICPSSWQTRSIKYNCPLHSQLHWSLI